MEMRMKDTFEITSGSIVISDPCYKNPSNELDNCKNGRYKFWANKNEEGYIKEVGFINVECEYSLEFYEYFKEIKIPVDSGQVGVFDRTFYRDNDVITDEDRGPAKGVCEDKPFYHACNTHTLGEEGFGTLTKGAVSISGHGDGLYYGNIYKDSKIDLVIGGHITFIEDSCDHCDNCCGSYCCGCGTNLQKG